MLVEAVCRRENDMASLITQDLETVILSILKRGNTAELKKERGNLVVVEIERKKRANVDILPKE